MGPVQLGQADALMNEWPRWSATRGDAKSATVVRSFPRRATGVVRRSASGLATGA